MVGVIIISESKAAVEQLRTVKRVLGKRTLPHIEPVVIKSDFSARTLKSKINTAINKVKSPDGVLILTELYGTTQCNVCLDFIHTDQVELISGYNLPMLIKAATKHESSTLKKLAKEVKAAGEKYIKWVK